MIMNYKIDKKIFSEIIKEGFKIIRKQTAGEYTRSQAITQLANKMEDLIRNDIEKHSND